MSSVDLCNTCDHFGEANDASRDLDIKRIQDYDGNTLSCRLTVGEAFVESQHIADRTVKVLREPPHPHELNNSLRFSSVAPHSSARPHRRSNNTKFLNAKNRFPDAVDAGTWIIESTEHSNGPAFKRQKVERAISSAGYQINNPPYSDNNEEVQAHKRPRSSGRRLSPERLVEDSQKSWSRRGLLLPEC